MGVEDVAKDADMAGSPEATRVTPGPAAVVVLAALRALVVRVAESMAAAELDCASAVGIPAGGEPPAMMVTPDPEAVEVRSVVGLAMEPMAPVWSWKGGAWAALIGNNPAGHAHWQLHAEPWAAAAAGAPVPEPA